MLDHVHIARNIFLYVCFGLTLSIQICGESVLNVSFQVFLFCFISDVMEYVVFASAYESSDTSRNQKKTVIILLISGKKECERCRWLSYALYESRATEYVPQTYTFNIVREPLNSIKDHCIIGC